MTYKEAWDAYQKAEAVKNAAQMVWQAATDQADLAFQTWAALDRAKQERLNTLSNPGDETVVNGADW